MEAAPLILTARLGESDFAFFDEMRRRHFPPARNLIPAHLTLFHKLPGEDLETIAASLGRRCAALPAIDMQVSGLRFLGYGVAYALAAPALEALRTELAREWDGWLCAQDRQGFRPHITIQNKAMARDAKALHQALQAEFQPFPARAVGLDLWHYRGGPWERAFSFAFKS